jgi:hypothetical protein
VIPFNDIMNPDDLANKLRSLINNNNVMLNKDLGNESDNLTMDGMDADIELAEPSHNFMVDPITGVQREFD